MCRLENKIKDGETRYDDDRSQHKTPQGTYPAPLLYPREHKQTRLVKGPSLINEGDFQAETLAHVG